ncbi:MAG: 30S ribosomal protein S9 [Patescibacteria group bacterium]
MEAKTAKSTTKGLSSTKIGDEAKKDDRPYVFAIGKRKTAVARVKLFPNGKGEMTINDRKLREYFLVGKDLSIFFAPFKSAEADEKKYDLEIKIMGGGIAAGAQACQLGVARALVKEDETRKGILRKAGFLTRDGRTKERKKPGLKRARRAPQWSKR